MPDALVGADADFLGRARRDEQLRHLPGRAGAQRRVDQHHLALHRMSLCAQHALSQQSLLDNPVKPF